MRHRESTFIAIAATLLTLGLPQAAIAAPTRIAVVVNAKNPITKIPIDGLRDLFLKRKTRWPGGKPIMLFNQPARSRIRVAFDRMVLRMSPEQVASHWIKRRIQGKGQPPPSIRSARTVLRIVAHQREALAYVPVDRLDGRTRGRVKVLIIDGRSIDDPKYPLFLLK